MTPKSAECEREKSTVSLRPVIRSVRPCLNLGPEQLVLGSESMT